MFYKQILTFSLSKHKEISNDVYNKIWSAETVLNERLIKGIGYLTIDTIRSFHDLYKSDKLKRHAYELGIIIWMHGIYTNYF